jgi:hypothetical protein
MGEKIISICKNGVRYDLTKGGPGSGRRKGENVTINSMDEDHGKEGVIIRSQSDDTHDVKFKDGRVRMFLGDDLKPFSPDSPLRVKSINATSENTNLNKQEPIASTESVISRGAIVTLRGHKGKVLLVEGDEANVSWEDASISKVPIIDLEFEGRVEKGGPGSGPQGGRSDTEEKLYQRHQLHQLNISLSAAQQASDEDKVNEIKEKMRNLGWVEKGGAGSGRFSDDLNTIQLHTAKHLRRQGVLPKKKK